MANEVIQIRKGSDGSYWVYRLASNGRYELLDGRGNWQPVKEGELNPNPTVPHKLLKAKSKMVGDDMPDDLEEYYNRRAEEKP